METLTPLEQKSNSLQPEDTTQAPIIHLSALSKYLIPLGNIFGPLLFWLIWRDKSKFVDFHGKEALNFNLSMLIYKLVILVLGLIMFISPFLAGLSRLDQGESPITFILSIPGFFLFIGGFGILEIVWIVLIIVAAIKAGNGEYYKYPLTLRLIK
jgi:uncharacterized Tic20 family protein